MVSNSLFREVKKVVEEILDLNAYYSENELRVMPAGTDCLYVYWEMTWSRMHAVAQFTDQDFRVLPKGLRIYDVTDILFDGSNAHFYRDEWVEESSDHKYIYNLPQGRNYIVDYGCFSQEEFIRLKRSTMVSLLCE